MKSTPLLIDNKDELWNNQFAQWHRIVTLKYDFSSLLKVCMWTGVEVLLGNHLEMNVGRGCIIVSLCILQIQFVVIMYECMELPQSKHSLQFDGLWRCANRKWIFSLIKLMGAGTLFWCVFILTDIKITSRYLLVCYCEIRFEELECWEVTLITRNFINLSQSINHRLFQILGANQRYEDGVKYRNRRSC
jgi:hypothetical protein